MRLKPGRKDRQGRKEVSPWYDIFEDWELIESSFAMQYNIRLIEAEDMDWKEFCTLLSGIMPKTPLGQIVSIRSEEDKDVLKRFSKAQHEIRNSWRSRHNPTEGMTEAEKAKAVNEIQELFARAFG